MHQGVLFHLPPAFLVSLVNHELRESYPAGPPQMVCLISQQRLHLKTTSLASWMPLAVDLTFVLQVLSLRASFARAAGAAWQARVWYGGGGRSQMMPKNQLPASAGSDSGPILQRVMQQRHDLQGVHMCSPPAALVPSLERKESEQLMALWADTCRCVQ